MQFQIRLPRIFTLAGDFQRLFRQTAGVFQILPVGLEQQRSFFYPVAFLHAQHLPARILPLLYTKNARLHSDHLHFGT